MPCLQIPSSNHRGNRRHLWSDMSLGGQMYQLQTLQPTSGAGTGQDGGVETSTEVTKNRTTQRTEKSDVSVSDDALFESINVHHVLPQKFQTKQQCWESVQPTPFT